MGCSGERGQGVNGLVPIILPYSVGSYHHLYIYSWTVLYLLWQILPFNGAFQVIMISFLHNVVKFYGLNYQWYSA